MVNIDPKIYRKFVSTYSKGSKLLYVEMKKALYRILKSALMFYLKLAGYLKRAGFKINPYDPCVTKANVGR